MSDNSGLDLLRIRVERGQAPDKLLRVLKKHLDDRSRLTVAQESGDTYVHVMVPDAGALREELDAAKIPHAYIAPLNVDPAWLGFSVETLALLESLRTMGAAIVGLSSNRIGAIAGEEAEGTELTGISRDQPRCTRADEVASGFASGEEGEWTVTSGVTPETIEAAINEAYANAVEAAQQHTFVDYACVEPCQCRYVINFAPEGTQQVSALEVRATASGKKAAVGIEASLGGGWTNVTAWVRWTLWRMCVAGPEADGQTTPNPASGTASVGNQSVSAACPTRSDRGEVTLRRDWSYSINFNLEDPDVVLRRAIEELRQDVAVQCLDAAARAIEELDTCPSHCPRSGDVSMMISPAQVTVSNASREVGFLGYSYEAQLEGSAFWAVFKPCGPAT